MKIFVDVTNYESKNCNGLVNNPSMIKVGYYSEID